MLASRAEALQARGPGHDEQALALGARARAAGEPEGVGHVGDRRRQPVVAPHRARDPPHPQPLPAHVPRIAHRAQTRVEGDVEQPVQADPGRPPAEREAHLHGVARPAARGRDPAVHAQPRDKLTGSRFV